MTITRTPRAILLAAVTVATLTVAGCSGTEPTTDTPTMSADGSMTPEESMAPDEPMESEDSMASAESMESMASMPADVEMSDAAAPATAGAFVSLATYEGDPAAFAGTDVVLFFNASWCPDCQATVANLEGDPAAIPTGLTVVSVDFDDSDELRQKYGVTVQHTFVQVGDDGSEVGKWTGTFTAQEIAQKTA